MKKKLTLFIVMLLSIAAFTQDLPKIAVYVNDDVPTNKRVVFRKHILDALINSDSYTVIDLETERERVKRQRRNVRPVNEIINNLTSRVSIELFEKTTKYGQIIRLSEQLGAGYICVADIIRIGNEYMIFSSIVNLETNEIISVGKSRSYLQTMNDYEETFENVVRDMLSGVLNINLKSSQILTQMSVPTVLPCSISQSSSKTNPSHLLRAPSFWAVIGILGAGTLVYGIYENEEIGSHSNKGKYSSAKQSVKKRNIAYSVGTLGLSSGITLPIILKRTKNDSFPKKLTE